MSDQTHVDVQLMHGKQVSKHSLPRDSTVASLRQIIWDDFGIALEDATLIVRGKRLSDGETLATSKKILIIYAPKHDQVKLQESETKLRDKLVAREKYAASFVTPKRIATLLDGAQVDKYTFHGIDILPQFLHRREEARALLEKIREDDGIKHIMKKHEYSVNRLIELSPAEENILGYNRNMGELIAIRLRTNDLQGFRPYDMILKTVLHELTHIQISPHDTSFHTLCSQHNKEYHEFWSKRRGGEHVMDASVSRTARYDQQEEEQTDEHGYEGGIWVLGDGDKPSTRDELRAARTRAFQNKK